MTTVHVGRHAKAKEMDKNEILDTVIALCQDDDWGGICTKCHETNYGVEPDAEGYECESCGAMAVCGAEQYLLLNVPYWRFTPRN